MILVHVEVHLHTYIYREIVHIYVQYSQVPCVVDS